MRISVICASALTVASLSSAIAADAASGKPLFEQRCVMCHGTEGKGDGPAAASLPADQKPRDLSKGSYKFATDDAKMTQLLKGGGPAVGLSMMMPPQPDLKDEDIANIIAFVKSLKK